MAFCVALGGGLDLAVAHAAEPATHAAASAQPALKVKLELATESVPEAQRPELETLIEAELESLGQAHDFVPTAEGEADLVVRAEVSQPKGQTAVFLISASVEFEGETIAEVREDVCLRCTTPEVAAETLALLPGAVTQAHEARAEAPPPAPEIAAEDPEPQPQPPVQARGAALGPVGYVGIASGALGLGAAIVGSVLLHRGEVVTTSPGAAQIEGADYRPPGVALIGVGLGALVVGNVLLAVDLSVLREGRSRSRARLTGLGLTVHGAPGLSVRGQF